MDISVLVACLTGLLKHTDLVTSPPVHSSIVQLLLAMLSPQVGGALGVGWEAGSGLLGCSLPAAPAAAPTGVLLPLPSWSLGMHDHPTAPRRCACTVPCSPDAAQLDYRRMGGGALGPRRVSPAEAALVTAVLGTGAAQTDLLPALMAAYAHADHVVGLDVDRDQYDKFHLRGCIDALLMELWRDPTLAASLSAAASSGGGGLFASFVGAVLNDLMYLLKDSLQVGKGLCCG